jgi:hypothetical protein
MEEHKIDTSITIEDILKLPPSEREKMFRTDERVITDLIHQFSMKYHGYVAGFMIIKADGRCWNISVNMNGELLDPKLGNK